MESKDIYIQCIYSQVKDAVEAFNRKLTQKLEAKPPKEKKKLIRKKPFVSVFVHWVIKKILFVCLP